MPLFVAIRQLHVLGVHDDCSACDDGAAPTVRSLANRVSVTRTPPGVGCAAHFAHCRIPRNAAAAGSGSPNVMVISSSSLPAIGAILISLIDCPLASTFLKGFGNPAISSKGSPQIMSM